MERAAIFTGGATANGKRISVMLHSHGGAGDITINVPTDLRVAEFIEQAISLLSQGEDAERSALLLKNYRPVLELVQQGQHAELEGHHTLAAAGVTQNAMLQIAAQPIKEAQLFCRYALRS